MLTSYLIAILVMGVAAYIDQKERIVPNWLTGGALCIGFLISLIWPEIHNASTWMQGGLSALGDCLFIFCILCWYSEAAERILQLEYGIGGGDIKIMGALASILNIKIVLLIMVIWPVIGMVKFAITRIKDGEIFGYPCCPDIFAALILTFPFLKWI